MKVYNNITEIIGKTPLMRMRGYEKARSLDAAILAKLEFFNPSGSSKVRIANTMIESAEAAGIIHPGSVIIEPTSGNTGIGLAAVARARGYRAILVMPDTMSVERRKLLKAYGAEIVLTEGAKGMQGSIDKACELAKSIPGSFIPNQFINPANPKAHKEGTGPEIWQDTDGKVDIFVASVGTGGTLSGTGEYLKRQKPEIKIVAVEPADSPLLSQGWSGSHEIQGIGANFVPETLNRSIYDEILTATTEDAFRAVHEVAQNEGFLMGISGGAAVHAAAIMAKRPENSGKNIVVILPDSGERYLSGNLFE